MKVLNFGGIPTSLGEIINIKYHLDLVKHEYKNIRLGFDRGLWAANLHVESPDWPAKQALWDKYLYDIGQLFFSEFPYTLDPHPRNFGGCADSVVARIGISPQKPELAHLLCKGTPLNLDQEYIVITTKVRQLPQAKFAPLSIQLWRVLKQLTNKYKLVILGERKVEMRKEYAIYAKKKEIFGIYDNIMVNIPNDRILDLTVPALGETVSDLAQVQQDCLIMNQAKFVITIGIGGNFCMATSVAKMAIGYRQDTLQFTDRIFTKEYPNAIITKNWIRFIEALSKYL